LKSSLNRATPVLSPSKTTKLTKNPSKEFLNLKDTIEKQLQLPQFQQTVTNQAMNKNKNLMQLDSLGSSAITTDQSANMSLTSFSSSSINDVSLNKTAKLNSKIPTRVKYLNQIETYIAKPKLIDLEFKNELERLFSGIGDETKRSERSSSESKMPKAAYRPFVTNLKATNMSETNTNTTNTLTNATTLSQESNQTTPNRRLSIFNKNENSKILKSKSRDNSYSSKYEKSKQAKCSEKLKSLFGLISGNLIADYSDLLVDFKDDSLVNDDLNEMESSGSEEASAGISNKTFNLLKSIDFMIDNEELKSINNEKLIQFLINIMVKSCRMYDVATMKTDEKVSYWRYANPIVAAYKSRSRNANSHFSFASKLKNSKKKQQTESSTQTPVQLSTDTVMYCEESNTSFGTEINQNTVIEAKPFPTTTTSISMNNTVITKQTKEENLLTQSIIELISESLSTPVDSSKSSSELSQQNLTRKLFRLSSSKSSRKENENNKHKEEIKIIKKTNNYNNNNQKKLLLNIKDDIEKIELKIKREEELLKESDINFTHVTQSHNKNKNQDIEIDNKQDILFKDTKCYYYVNKNKNDNEAYDHQQVEATAVAEENEEEELVVDEEDIDEENDKINKNIKLAKAQNSTKSINKNKRSIHYGLRSSNNNNNNIDNRHGHSYHQRRSQRRSIRMQNNNTSKLIINNNNNSNSKAQDETLRDAENISDIDNELDIDQWADINNSNSNSNSSNNNNNNNNRKSIAQGTELNSKNTSTTLNKKNKTSDEDSNDIVVSLTRTDKHSLLSQPEHNINENEIEEEEEEEEKKEKEGKEELKGEENLINNIDNRINNSDKHISSTSLSISSTPLSLSSTLSSSSSNNKCDALCMFNSTSNVCHLYKTNNSEPPAKLKSPKHISVQVNLELEEDKNKDKEKEVEEEEEEEEKVKLNENIIKTTKQQQEKVENMENIISAKIKDWNNCSTNSTTSKSSKKAAHIQNKIERTHSLDSLENDELDEVSQSTNKHIVIDAQNHSDFNVDLDINISRIDPVTNAPIVRKKSNSNSSKHQELSEIPEIKIDFEYQIKKNFTAADHSISPKSKSSNDDAVKKRARESLKFWKEEEEKRRQQHESSSSLNNSYSIMSTATSFSSASNDHHHHEKKTKHQTKSPTITIKRVKDRINVFETINDSTTQLSQTKLKAKKKEEKKPIQLVTIDSADDTKQIPIQSIQSRIKTFEQSLNKNQSSTSSTTKHLSSQSVETKSTHIRLSSSPCQSNPYKESEAKSEQEKLTFNEHSPRNSFNKLSSSRSLDCELDTQSCSASTGKSCIRIPIILTTRVNSNSNYSIKNFSYQIQQPEHKLDKKKNLNHSLGNLIVQDISETCPKSSNLDDATLNNENEEDYGYENNNEEFEEEIEVTSSAAAQTAAATATAATLANQTEEENHDEEDHINQVSEHQDKSATSQTSFLSSNLVIETSTQQTRSEMLRNRDDSENEMEEVEIIIDLNNLHSSKANAHHHHHHHSKQQQQQNVLTRNDLDQNDSELLVDERLKNIVMHMIPTTRKAYVDDIVDGIKQLINDPEAIRQISSPIDLPKHAVKFIQKRYASLLNDQLLSKTESSVSALPTYDHDLDNEEEEEETKHSDSISNTTANIMMDTTTEVTVVKETRKEFMIPSHSEANPSNDDIMKFEEETLYIVEKRRPIPVNILCNKSTSTLTATVNDVDSEIRKNFQLKPKDEIKYTNTIHLDLAKTVTLTKSNDEYVSSPSPSPSPSPPLTLPYKHQQQHQHQFNNIKSVWNGLLEELKESVSTKNDDINDFQLHFFDLNNSKRAVLLMLFDKDNSDNYRFSLEKKYHKSIIDTHVTNRKNDINIVAHLNVYFMNDQLTEISNKANQFDLLSLIRPPTTNEDIASITNKKMFNSLPIGKYFVDIKYKCIINKMQIDHKESLIDLSLLPLPIRSQLIYELENSADANDDPAIELIVIDNHLFRMKMIRTKENLIREAFRKHSTNIDDSMKYLVLNNIMNLGSLRNELRQIELENNQQIDKLLKSLEIELNSFYICERVISNNENRQHSAEIMPDDLVKLNRIDALVSFECAQKYKDILAPVKVSFNQNSNDDSQNNNNMFYLLDNGKYYRCLLPISDLIQKTSDAVMNSNLNYLQLVEDLQHSSVSLSSEMNSNMTQTFIFSRHLPQMYGINFDEHKIKSVYLKQISNQDDFIMSLDKLNIEDEENLPSFSESISESMSKSNPIINNAYVPVDTQQILMTQGPSQDEEKFKRDFLYNLTQNKEIFTVDQPAEKIQIQSYDNNYTFMTNNNDYIETNHSYSNNINESYNYQAQQSHQHEFNQQYEQQQPQQHIQQETNPYHDVELTQFETDRLKLDLHLSNIASYSAKQIRDKIIINEIDKMFSSIRDHQGSTAKAKGEEKLIQLYTPNKKKKGCTWSYSSSKRHVRAKIMEMPIAEDLSQLVKNIGLNDLVLDEENHEDTIEKVFVRIDDYLNQEVSKSMQRSYSYDYLNHLASGCRTRIRYIRIPGQTMKTQSMMSYPFTTPIPISEAKNPTEYRTAPYDLRYWSILKLLEEERNTENGQILNIFDDSYTKNWSKSEHTAVPTEKLIRTYL